MLLGHSTPQLRRIDLQSFPKCQRLWRKGGRQDRRYCCNQVRYFQLVAIDRRLSWLMCAYLPILNSAAISAGARCGQGCDSTTTSPAVVYIPSGYVDLVMLTFTVADFR